MSGPSIQIPALSHFKTLYPMIINRRQPLVSVILINYNSFTETVECVKSINKSLYQNIEIVVVDNGSRVDEGPQAIEGLSAYPIKWIRSNENLGFAGGNNLGVKNANGDFYFFLNNDAEVTSNTIEILLETYLANNNAGLLCPKIKSHNTNIIEYTGFTELSLMMRNSAPDYKKEDINIPLKVSETYYAHGAAVMISKHLFQICGAMPEEYFLYYEELDWSHQVRKKGYQILVNTAAIVYHKSSMSIGKSSPLKLYYETRNRILFCKRNRPFYKAFPFYLYSAMIFPIKTLLYLVTAKFKHLKAYLKGSLYFIFPTKYHN